MYIESESLSVIACKKHLEDGYKVAASPSIAISTEAQLSDNTQRECCSVASDEMKSIDSSLPSTAPCDEPIESLMSTVCGDGGSCGTSTLTDKMLLTALSHFNWYFHMYHTSSRKTRVNISKIRPIVDMASINEIFGDTKATNPILQSIKELRSTPLPFIPIVMESRLPKTAPTDGFVLLHYNRKLANTSMSPVISISHISTECKYIFAQTSRNLSKFSFKSFATRDLSVGDGDNHSALNFFGFCVKDLEKYVDLPLTNCSSTFIEDGNIYSVLAFVEIYSVLHTFPFLRRLPQQDIVPGHALISLHELLIFTAVKKYLQENKTKTLVDFPQANDLFCIAEYSAVETDIYQNVDIFFDGDMPSEKEVTAAPSYCAVAAKLGVSAAPSPSTREKSLPNAEKPKKKKSKKKSGRKTQNMYNNQIYSDYYMQPSNMTYAPGYMPMPYYYYMPPMNPQVMPYYGHYPETDTVGKSASVAPESAENAQYYYWQDYYYTNYYGTQYPAYYNYYPADFANPDEFAHHPTAEDVAIPSSNEIPIDENADNDKNPKRECS